MLNKANSWPKWKIITMMDRQCFVNIQLLFKMQIQLKEEQHLVSSIAVIDIDPALALYRPSQQKWVSSLELTQEIPKDNKNNNKIVTLTQGLYLLINFCEKNRSPICQLDFLAQPNSQWIAMKMPSAFPDRYGGLTLCYKTEDVSISEPLTDIDVMLTERKRLQEKQIFTLPQGYKIVSNNPMTHNFLIYKRMRSLLEQTFKPILLQRYPQQSKHINHSMLPIFCFPEGIHLSKQLKGFISFNFILTNQTGDRIYVSCLSFKQCLDESLKHKLNFNSPDKIYYQKAICILSRHRYTDQFSECLKHLYRLSMSKNDVPFHKVVASYVNNMVLPKEIGINGLSYSYGGSNINFDTNNTYPIVSERGIYCVFKFLPLQCIISIFEAILLQKKIIFVSQSKTILGYAIQAFLALTFPFRWEHVLIPILPSTLKEYMAAPVPIIVGINPSMVDNTIEADSIIIQMDSGTVLNDEDLPPLPDKLEKQLRKRLQQFQIYDENDVKQYLQTPESTYIFKMQEVEHPQFAGHIVRDCFYQFMLTLMKNYKKFWKVQRLKDGKDNSSLNLTEPQLLNDIFKVQDFLSDLGMSKVGSFGYKFTEGTIFTSFIERRHQFVQDPQLNFFDDSLDKKKAKKDIKLIQKIANIRYIVCKHPEPEAVKSTYVYERFPSVLGKGIMKEEQIAIQIQDFNQQELQFLEQFMEEEFRSNRQLFCESESNDIDYKIQSLLLQQFKKKYILFKQQTGLGVSKSDAFHSSVGSSKLKNSRVNYDKLKLFQKLYLQQIQAIQTLFLSWPYQQSCLMNVKEVPKRQYLTKYLRNDLFEQEQLYSVYEEYYGYKYRNYEMMIKNNVKIIFLQRKEAKSKAGYQNLRNSRRKIKYHYEVYIEHFKIKNFLNKIIPVQAHSLFSFILQKIKEENCYEWTLETLIEWKSHLQKKGRQ